MKYLKMYEAYIADDRINDFINWEMIEDAKDMALEYIDDGLTLYISIFYRHKYLRSLYTLTYNHVEDKFKIVDGAYKILPTLPPDTFLTYGVILYDSKNKFKIDRVKSNELIGRISKAYPNEEITMMI